MNPRLLPPWARVMPVALLMALIVAGSAAFTEPVQQATAETPAVVAIVAEDGHHALLVAPDLPPPPRPALPAGAIGMLSIPRISVNAVAREVGVTRAGAMDTTPGIWDVGVFNRAVRPGEPGNAIIEGHLDWYTGPAVFYHLHTLSIGDRISFTAADGTTHHFAVSRSRTVAYNSTIPDDLYAREGTPTITLITCSGTYLAAVHSYSTRLLLTAALVE